MVHENGLGVIICLGSEHSIMRGTRHGIGLILTMVLSTAMRIALRMVLGM